jgi:hypothetical protein
MHAEDGPVATSSPDRPQPERAGGRSRPSGLGWLSPALTVLTVLALVTAMLAVWVRTTVLETDRFMAIVEPALSDEAFPAALRDVVAEQVLVALDLDTRVSATLDELDRFLVDSIRDALDLDVDPAVRSRLSRRDRPTLTALAPGIATALEARVVEVVDAFVRSDILATRYADLVRQGHFGAVALVRGDEESLPNVSVDEDAVRLDLVPVTAAALQRVTGELQALLPDTAIPEVVGGRADDGRAQLEAALRTRLPDDFGQLAIMSRDDLDTLQAPVRAVDRLVVAVVGLALALVVATVVTARDRRRTLLHLGIGVVLGAGAAVLLVERIEAAILAEITGPNGLRVAGVLLDEVTGNLRSVTLVVAVSAQIVIALASGAGGQGGWLGETLAGHRARSGRRTDGGPVRGQAATQQREDHP